MESLIPVIVGGLIGLAGGVVGPPLAHWLNEGSSNRKKRAEKLEEMIGYIYAHDHWLAGVRDIRVFGKQDNGEPSPLPRAQAISAIFFPQFVAELTSLEHFARIYHLWTLAKGKERLEGKTDNLSDGQVEAYTPYMNKHSELLSALREFAASEFTKQSPPWKRIKKVE